MFVIETEYTMDFAEVEKYLQQHAYELLTELDARDVDFVQLGNSTDTSWDPAAIGYRVVRNHSEHNTVDFWLVRTRSGRALLALTTEGSRYSTCAESFNERAPEFEAAREKLIAEMQTHGVSDAMLTMGRQFAAIDYESLYSDALRRTFHDGVIPERWRQMPHMTAL